MFKIDNSTSAAAPDALPAAGAEGNFTNGNPVGPVPATVVDSWWLNMVQAELAAPVDAAGIVHDKTNNAQVLKALKRLFAGYSTVVAANTALTVDNCGVVLINAAGGNVTVTLCAANAGSYSNFIFIRTDNSANTVTVQRAGADTGDFGTSFTLPTQFASRSIETDGASVWYSVAGGGPSLPPKYVSPYTVANNGTTSIDVGAISVRSDDNSTDIVIPATITKSLGGAWVAGSVQNGLDVGGAAVANGTLHFFAIKNPATGATDVLMSASLAAPTLPGGFTKKAWIYSLRLNASVQFIPFSYKGGDLFLYTTSVQDANGASSTTVASLFTISVPNGIPVEALARISHLGSTTVIPMIFTSPDEADQTPSAGYGDIEFQVSSTAMLARVAIRTSTQQIRTRATAASTFAWNTYAFRILR